MRKQSYKLPIICSCVYTLTGCGLLVPEMQEPFSKGSAEKFNENNMVNQIKCELHKGVQDTLAKYEPGGPEFGNNIDWLSGWGAKVSLALTVDEKSGLTPGLTFLAPMETKTFTIAGASMPQSQSFSLGLGLQASGDATRKETIGFTYSFADLLKEKAITSPCDNEGGLFIHSDLKIDEFMETKAFLAKVPGTVKPTKPGSSPFSTFTYEATFVIVYGGSVTPTWKLARLSANSSSSLLALTRTKTQDVTITMGPVDVDSSPTTPAILSPEALNANFAAVLGQAIATAIQSQQH